MRMQHDHFACEQSDKLIGRELPAVEAGLAAGVIANAALEWCRSGLSQAYDDERSSLTRSNLRKLEAAIGLYDPVLREIDKLLPYQLVHLGSVGKRVAAVRRRYRDDFESAAAEAISDVEAFVARWEPVRAALETLKKVAVKGRRPVAPEERKTPARTLDHTGSCACCLRNVKLSDDEKVVDHGFTVAWGTREGRCFGVDFPAIEVATDGLEAWVAHVEAQVPAAAAALKETRKGLHEIFDPYLRRMLKPEDHDYQQQLHMHVAAGEHRLKSMRTELAAARRRLAAWEPRALPDGRSDHLASMSPR